MASIRIVSADYYMSYPNCDLDVVYSEFRGTEVRQVPVIQIFGSTQEGKKTCLNIHGVFPYVYIPYDGIENAGTLSYKIASELDKTINISLGQGSSNTCHIHNIILSSGLPIYGYHEKQHQFFKIYFYNPAIIKKACSLLENGSILGKCFQPHESHISYILQFMVDYNLHGMSFLNVSQVKYRPNPKYPDQLASIPKDKILPSSLQRRSVCELEMDCFACDITNVEEIQSGRLGTNPGINALWEDERQRRRDKQQDSQISFCLSQERDVAPAPTTTHEFFAQRLSEKLSSEHLSDLSDVSCVELDNSVYPAETPDDLDYTITPANVSSFVNTSMFEDSVIPDSQAVPELSQTDRNLLEILKELKENVHIEDDSALSQQNPEPEMADCSSGDSDNEQVTLSLPLNKTVEVADEDVWNDSFWEGECAFPQLDGTQDVLPGLVGDVVGSSASEVDVTSLESEEVGRRYASEVFIVKAGASASAGQQLRPGVNSLVTTEPQHRGARVRVLSDVRVKSDRSVRLSWHLLAPKHAHVQLSIDIERRDDEEEFVDPLPYVEDFEDCLSALDADADDIVWNDVNFGDLTPSRADALTAELSPKTPHAHANQCACRQSPCNAAATPPADDYMNLFIDRLYENSLPSSSDKENVATPNTAPPNTLNTVKRNLKLGPTPDNRQGEEGQGQLLKYNLRSAESTPKHRKCCRWCVDSAGCAKQTQATNKREPQLKLKKLLNKLESKRKTNVNAIEADNNKERILVQIPLAKLLRKPKKGRPQVDPSSDTNRLKINEKNNNKIILTENKLINIPEPVKQRESDEATELSSECSTTTTTTESEELPSKADVVKLKKLELMNWNLDGQNDTPSSDSEHSQRNGVPGDEKEKEKEKDPAPKPVRTRSSAQKGAPKCIRLSGLAKPERATRASQQKKKSIDAVNNQTQVTQNGDSASPSRLLRNRKIPPEPKIINDLNVMKISPKILRKRKSEIDTNNTNNASVDKQSDNPKSEGDSFAAINDEFKENKMDAPSVDGAPQMEPNTNAVAPGKKEKKSKIVEGVGKPTLRNKSRYTEAERNLKRQKRLSLSLKHLREKQEETANAQNENENENETRKKELRVSLTQMPLDKLTTKATTPNTLTKQVKDLKVILEPLSVETLERYATKPSLIESSPQHKTEEPQVPQENENGNQRVTRSSLKAIDLKVERVESTPDLTLIATPETENNKRTTRQANQTQSAEKEGKRVTRQSSDSCDDVPEPIDENVIKIKKLNTTPTKKLKTSASASSPSPSPSSSSSSKKYIPLNVTKSPRTTRAVANNVAAEEITIEPLKKRLRNFDSNVNVEQENERTKKVRTSAIDGDCSRGIGELQDNPIIQEETTNNDAETQISATQPLSATTPNKHDLPNNCDNPIFNSPLLQSANRSKVPPLKTPDSVKANLFNTNNENNNNNNNSALVEYKKVWKEKEESFLNEIESICKNAATYNNHLYCDEAGAFKAPDKVALPSPSVTPPKKSVITSADYLDYSPFASPEKGAVSLPFFFNSRETLSQQFEKELEHDSAECYTKTKNLTIAERYDLERNYAPQPGTSKQHHGHATNVWMPKYYPPSAEDIRTSLAEYNIPEHRHEMPFYGNAADVTRQMDVGHNVLKIPGKTIADLDVFAGCLGFKGIETVRRERLKKLHPDAHLPKTNLYASLVSRSSSSIIQPMLLPPSNQDVLDWIQAKTEQKELKKPEKMRIVVPSSPGNNNNNNDEDCDVSFTLSPDFITPTPPKEATLSPSTPASSQQSPCLRSRKSARRGTLQRKALFSSIKCSQEQRNALHESHPLNNSCQITGVTLNNTHGFKLSCENLQNARALNENQHLTILVVELHVRTRGDLHPDPQYDAIRALFYSIYNDVPSTHHLPKQETGIIAVNTLPQSPSKEPPPPILNGLGLVCDISYVGSELELIGSLVGLVQKWDPDIFSGFEIELLSWGYLVERCYALGVNLPAEVSRVNPEIMKKKHENFEPTKQELKLTGRIVLDAWRLFRHEMALTSYTFENLMHHVLHRRVPRHTFKSLSFWWEHRTNHYRKITADYYVARAEGVLKLMDQLDLIGRTAELARLFGIQFYEVLSRGSQFRVESMMLRLAKPLNYISVSPSVQQRAKMRAPEWLPLIFEPQSRFYPDPIIVLDFQSLYPSIIIAYNYCFSTCVGRVERLATNQPFEFGATQLRVPRATLRKLQEQVTFSPCGVGFVSADVRKGILPRMLREILETRLMVRASMKRNKHDKLLQRVLHSRQLGLKLIANVTYGYTAANFSGRMPCSEVGDSVVSKGRETLERAIKLIERTDRWRATVVYGDTDSLFVQVAGRSREDAFKIGEEIADAVTKDNPAPVKLKLEKVYQPCILQTKKRYVGYMYESIDQKEPEYNAKGIETVRRDGCPAVAKMLEKSLRILFESRDVSLVKRYVCHQFEKILLGRASVQDLIFAREYRGASGYRPGACVPALELARRWTAVDKRREPRRGERVPYIVVHGPPGVPLIRLVRCPNDLLNLEPSQQMAYRPNAIYYITKVIIPPLNRCFALIGADVHTWYNEMPRKQLHILPTAVHYEKSKKSTISEYFATMNCAACDNQTTREGVCQQCLARPQRTIVALQEKIHKWERSCYEINQICQSCCGRNEQTECTSLDCPILYRFIQSKRDSKQVPFLRNLLCKF